MGHWISRNAGHWISRKDRRVGGGACGGQGELYIYIYIYIYIYNLHLVVFPPKNVTDDIDFRNGRHRVSEWKNTGKMMASQISLNICKYHKIPGRGFDRSLCPIFFGVELAWTWGHRFCWKFKQFQHNLCPSVVLALN